MTLVNRKRLALEKMQCDEEIQKAERHLSDLKEQRELLDLEPAAEEDLEMSLVLGGAQNHQEDLDLIVYSEELGALMDHGDAMVRTSIIFMGLFIFIATILMIAHCYKVAIFMGIMSVLVAVPGVMGLRKLNRTQHASMMLEQKLSQSEWKKRLKTRFKKKDFNAP